MRSAEVITTSRIKPAISAIIIGIRHVHYNLHSDVLLRIERERRLSCLKVTVWLASALALHVDQLSCCIVEIISS